MQSKSLQTKRALRTALLVLLLSVVGMGKVLSQNFIVDGLKYAVNEDGATVTVTQLYSSNPYLEALIIPESVTYESREYVVSAIGGHAFYASHWFDCSLTIPNSVTAIGDHAFTDCYGLSGSLTIPNSVTTIGESAFRDCSGFSGNLTIGNSVIEIGDYAFENCSGFTGSLAIPSSVTTIGVRSFYNCRGLSSIIVSNVETLIDQDAFIGTGWYDSQPDGILYLGGSCIGYKGEPYGSLHIAQGTRQICSGAFSNCIGFTGSLTIPNSVTSIGNNAFAGCSGFTGSLTIPNSVTKIEDFTFLACSGFTGELIIPNSVTYIGHGAFFGCSGFSGNLIIPNSVTEILPGTFAGCSGFTGSLTIPNSVVTIRDGSHGFGIVPLGAFEGCTGITQVTIGNSLTRIGANAFCGCSGFTGNLIIPNSVVEISKGAFAGCSGFTGELRIPNSVTIIESGYNDPYYYDSGAFENCNGFTSLVLGNSLTQIGSFAFKGCNGFTNKLIMPNSVTMIGEQAFEDCSFNGLDINMENIPDSAFEGCRGFGCLNIGNAVSTIGNSAFMDCSCFSSLNIGNSVTEIGSSAFSGCSGVTSLTIPSSVQFIDRNAFKNCTGLKEIYFDAKVCDRDGSIWPGCTGITTIVIGDSVEIITERFFSEIDYLTSVSIGKSVKYIGKKAFADNPRLNMIYYNVEKDLESDDDVFDNCPNLTTIHIGPEVKEIGSNIFKGCNTVHFVVALGPTPAVLDAGAFSDIVDNSVLMVSCGKRVTYYSVWNMFPFNNIIEDCDTYGINVGAVGSGGTITTSVTEAQMGQEVQITITPNPGMALVSIKVVNANDPTQIIPISPSGRAASTYSFTMPPFEVVVMATFKNSGASVDENNSVEVAVYPNPTNGLLKIEAENIKHISISNILGQVVFDGKVGGDAFEYDFSVQKAGIYLVRIETASGVAVKKVSITR